MENNLKNGIDISNLYKNIQELIEISKSNVAMQVNSEITMLYYNIGKEIKEDILKLEKPEYGKSLIKELSRRLMEKYGKGYSYSNIYRMIQLVDNFDNIEFFCDSVAKIKLVTFYRNIKN